MFWPITLAVCSNRIDFVYENWKAAHRAIREGDQLLFVFDCKECSDSLSLKHDIEKAGASVIFGSGAGLSSARNCCLKSARHNAIIFIDDDVVIDAEAVDAIRKSLVENEIVGVRIKSARHTDEFPWYISPGQYHYLCIHSRTTLGRTWGACMGLSLSLIQNSGLLFDESLGRRNGSFLSGEDTSFLAQMREQGAREVFHQHIWVYHNLSAKRLGFRSFLKRILWQGRTEVVRKQALPAVSKEWQRYLSQKNCLTYLLAVFYIMIFCTGIFWQKLVDLKSALWLVKGISKNCNEY